MRWSWHCPSSVRQLICPEDFERRESIAHQINLHQITSGRFWMQWINFSPNESLSNHFQRYVTTIRSITLSFFFFCLFHDNDDSVAAQCSTFGALEKLIIRKERKKNGKIKDIIHAVQRNIPIQWIFQEMKMTRLVFPGNS